MTLIHATQKRGRGFTSMTKGLVAELKRTASEGEPLNQPLLLENDIRESNTLHVAVIWEMWAKIPSSDRGKIIMDAYEEAALDRVERITLAMGLTTLEAVELGLLPYAIVTKPKRQDIPPKVREIMKAEGAVETPDGFVLRFPNQESCEAALARMKVPPFEDGWSVEKDPNVED